MATGLQVISGTIRESCEERKKNKKNKKNKVEKKKKPVEETNTFLIITWCLIVVLTGIYFAFAGRHFAAEYSIGIPIAQAAVVLWQIINLSVTWLMDPGIIPRPRDDEAAIDGDFRSPLYRHVEVHGADLRLKWCTTCQIYRPPRSSHCRICDNCVEEFDHHCPWVNNCIGRRNYRYFFMFLVTTCLHLSTMLVQCVVYLVTLDVDDLGVVTVLGAILTMADCVLIGFVFLSVQCCTGFHIYLIKDGLTTNEEVIGRFKGGYNPYKRRGCLSNLWFICCGPRWPKLVGYVPPQKREFGKIAADIVAADNNDTKIYTQASSTGNEKTHHDNSKMRVVLSTLSLDSVDYYVDEKDGRLERTISDVDGAISNKS